MVVGYALGNRNDSDSEIQVLGEDNEKTLTYTKSLPVVISRMCRNKCPYCGFNKKDNLTVPYSTISIAKKARLNGTREAYFVAGERPDKFAHIRATLDLWGFSSYLDYVYTICELGFLEGLIPVIELGFISPEEMKKLSEVCALTKIMMDTVDESKFDDIYPLSPGKRLDLRTKSLEWAGKLGFPTITGLIVGIGESQDVRKSTFEIIADIHKEYGTIHEVTIQNFVPEKGTLFEGNKTATKATMLKTVELAKSILPSDVSINIPIENNPDFEDYIKAGITDLGRITAGNKSLIGKMPSVTEEELYRVADKLGYELRQRFPLRKEFIKEGKYSKKLGQVFDSYRYKIKKETQEKIKEAKLSGNGNRA